MKVVGINGSPRQDGNTAILIRTVFAELNAAGIETELIQLSGKNLKGCIACWKCMELKNGRCIMDDDYFNDCLKKMIAADGIILGSPVYSAGVTSQMKALIDRAGYVSAANGRFLKRKVGAALVAVRRGGAVHAFDTMNHLFLITEMIIPGSCYWNMGIGRDKGDVEKDEEGMRTMRVLGENMAWLLKKLAHNA